MPEATLVLIRHGHTQSNGGHREPRMSGWTDFALSERGHDQVRRLKARLVREPPFSAVYSSPLTRALQTAAPLVTGGLVVCAELKEIDCGDVDGAPIEEVKRQYAELWAANLRQEDDHFRWPGGESYAELRERVLAAATKICRRHAGERVALVTHAGVISQLVGSVLGSRPARWQDHRPENTGLSTLVARGGTLSLESFDDHRHLAVPEQKLATLGFSG